MTSDAARHNGLATYRKRMAEEKKQQMAVLRELRKSATVEVIEGRTFKVVKIPDGYYFKPLRKHW